MQSLRNLGAVPHYGEMAMAKLIRNNAEILKRCKFINLHCSYL